MHLSLHKTGLALGFVVAGIHIVWSLLVALSWGQWWVNFMLWAHMVQVPVVVNPFNWVASLTVIIVTFLIAYAIGCKFAWFWNKLHKV